MQLFLDSQRCLGRATRRFLRLVNDHHHVTATAAVAFAASRADSRFGKTLVLTEPQYFQYGLKTEFQARRD